MISIKPEYVAEILNGNKTIEIRKSLPKCDLPINVYIYCTKGGRCIVKNPSGRYVTIPNLDKNEYFNGKIVAKFTLSKIEQIRWNHDIIYGESLPRTKSLRISELLSQSRLFSDDLADYVGDSLSYAWQIDDLEIFDKPKEISEYKPHYGYPTNHRLTRAPQSWQYIEVSE